MMFHLKQLIWNTNISNTDYTLCWVDCYVAPVLRHPIVVPCVLCECLFEYFIAWPIHTAPWEGMPLR